MVNSYNSYPYMYIYTFVEPELFSLLPLFLLFYSYSIDTFFLFLLFFFYLFLFVYYFTFYSIWFVEYFFLLNFIETQFQLILLFSPVYIYFWTEYIHVDIDKSVSNKYNPIWGNGILSVDLFIPVLFHRLIWIVFSFKWGVCSICCAT